MSKPTKQKGRVPSSVVIGGKRVRIVVEKLDDESYGQCAFDGMKITLSPSTATNTRLLRDTLRHEMIHSALKISGVSFSERYEEEVIVRCLENIFFPAWDRIANTLP